MEEDEEDSTVVNYSRWRTTRMANWNSGRRKCLLVGRGGVLEA